MGGSTQHREQRRVPSKESPAAPGNTFVVLAVVMPPCHLAHAHWGRPLLSCTLTCKGYLDKAQKVQTVCIFRAVGHVEDIITIIAADNVW